MDPFNYNKSFFLTGGTPSLRELCISVIVSAVLQRKALDFDQVRLELPGYVSPAAKNMIVSELKEYDF